MAGDGTGWRHYSQSESYWYAEMTPSPLARASTLPFRKRKWVEVGDSSCEKAVDKAAGVTMPKRFDDEKFGNFR